MASKVGLSNRDKPASLLKQVNNRHLKPTPKVDDPPQSTDDEEDEAEFQPGPLRRESSNDSIPEPTRKPRLSRLSYAGSDGSDDERQANANIKRTKFVSSSQTNEGRKRSAATRSQAEDDNGRQKKKAAPARVPSAKRQKLPVKDHADKNRSPAPSSSATHLEDSQGFTKVVKSKTTYTKKPAIAMQPPGSYTGTSRPPKKLKAPDAPESPKKAKASKLRVPGDVITSPPPKRMSLKPVKDESPAEADDSIPSPAVKSNSEKREKRERTKGASKRSKRKPEREKSPPAPKAVFRMPLPFSEINREYAGGDDARLATFDILSDLESDAHSAEAAGSDKEAERIPLPTLCPWCAEPVEKAFLDDFSKGKRMNVRMQTKFCQKHKRNTALETWQSRGYPEIDWPLLEDRFAKHHRSLLAIVKGEPSHYRNILAENVESGKARSLKQEDDLNPGYYGPRGFNLMCDYFVGKFGDLLKQRALNDRVISGRGSAAFIQSVLVAELAVRLVEEDMDVEADEAREIMEESKVLGEMVHEE